MKRNGTYALDFQVPALVGRQLSYLCGRQLVGRVVALCFPQDPERLSAPALDRHAARFQRMDAALLIVSADARPLHRWGDDQSAQPWTSVLADPCGRLHRSFGVASTESSPRCRTFVIDRAGILRLRLSHDFVDGDLEALWDLLQPIDRAVAGKATTAIKTECQQI